VAEALSALPAVFSSPMDLVESLVSASASASARAAGRGAGGSDAVRQLVWYWLATGRFAELELRHRRALLRPATSEVGVCMCLELLLVQPHPAAAAETASPRPLLFKVHSQQFKSHFIRLQFLLAVEATPSERRS